MIVNKFIKKGLPSFCTSNFDVLKIIIKFSKIHQLPVLIESTSNQVNQFGGYTGLTPATFKKKIEYNEKDPSIVQRRSIHTNKILKKNHLITKAFYDFETSILSQEVNDWIEQQNALCK